LRASCTRKKCSCQRSQSLFSWLILGNTTRMELRPRSSPQHLSMDPGSEREEEPERAHLNDQTRSLRHLTSCFLHPRPSFSDCKFLHKLVHKKSICTTFEKGLRKTARTDKRVRLLLGGRCCSPPIPAKAACSTAPAAGAHPVRTPGRHPPPQASRAHRRDQAGPRSAPLCTADSGECSPIPGFQPSKFANACFTNENYLEK
jgi:hypothetical protein